MDKKEIDFREELREKIKETLTDVMKSIKENIALSGMVQGEEEFETPEKLYKAILESEGCHRIFNLKTKEGALLYSYEGQTMILKEFEKTSTFKLFQEFFEDSYKHGTIPDKMHLEVIENTYDHYVSECNDEIYKKLKVMISKNIN